MQIFAREWGGLAGLLFPLLFIGRRAGTLKTPLASALLAREGYFVIG